jgi:hypothetical protein
MTGTGRNGEREQSNAPADFRDVFVIAPSQSSLKTFGFIPFAL